MATGGEKKWPPMGRNRWALTLVSVPFRRDSARRGGAGCGSRLVVAHDLVGHTAPILAPIDALLISNRTWSSDHSRLWQRRWAQSSGSQSVMLW
jgi:hypothetical protein